MDPGAAGNRSGVASRNGCVKERKGRCKARPSFETCRFGRGATLTESCGWVRGELRDASCSILHPLPSSTPSFSNPSRASPCPFSRPASAEGHRKSGAGIVPTVAVNVALMQRRQPYLLSLLPLTPVLARGLYRLHWRLQDGLPSREFCPVITPPFLCAPTVALFRTKPILSDAAAFYVGWP